MLVVALAYAAEALRRLSHRALRARAARDRGRAQADRVRAARLGQAAPARRAPARHLAAGPRARTRSTQTVARAAIELESAASDMDTSLAELRSPLEGRRLDEALRARARRSSRAPDGPRIAVQRPTRPDLPPLVGAHAYRIAGEALTQRAAPRRRDDDRHRRSRAARRAAASSVRDDGRGLPEQARPGATGLLAMENRAATIGARLTVATRRRRRHPDRTRHPPHRNGGPP